MTYVKLFRFRCGLVVIRVGLILVYLTALVHAQHGDHLMSWVEPNKNYKGPGLAKKSE